MMPQKRSRRRFGIDFYEMRMGAVKSVQSSQGERDMTRDCRRIMVLELSPCDGEETVMKTLTARVLDPKHLELSEALPTTTGELIRIVIAGRDGSDLLGANDPDLASDPDIELAAVQDTSEDFLSEEELTYYLQLEDS